MSPILTIFLLLPDCKDIVLSIIKIAKNLLITFYNCHLKFLMSAYATNKRETIIFAVLMLSID